MRGILLLTNPTYLAPLFSGVLGIGLLVLGVIMLVIGGLWLNKTVSLKF